MLTKPKENRRWKTVGVEAGRLENKEKYGKEVIVGANMPRLRENGQGLYN